MRRCNCCVCGTVSCLHIYVLQLAMATVVPVGSGKCQVNVTLVLGNIKNS